MDRRRLIIGGLLLVLVCGLILLSFTEGGIFNPVIPYVPANPGLRTAFIKRDPTIAYRDFTREGPAAGLVLLTIGAIGLIYVWVVKTPG
jgi:hypothetical protein